MAVIVKYIVVRDGVEKMTFMTKKEADVYDKMLDIADNLYDLMETADIELEDDQMTSITLFLAENREMIIPILRGLKPKPPKPEEADAEAAKAKTDNPGPAEGGKKTENAKAANPKPAAKPKPAVKRKKRNKK